MAKTAKISTSVEVATVVLQRFSLLALVFGTFIHWALLVTTTVANGFTALSDSLRIADPDGMTNIGQIAVNVTQRNVLVAALVAILITAALLYIEEDKVVRRRGLINYGSVIAFCVLATLLSQVMIRAFLDAL